MITTERIAIDLNNWQDKEPATIIRDTACFAVEARKGPAEKRINAGVAKLTEFENLVDESSRNPEDIATLRIFEWAKQDSPSIQIFTRNPLPEDEEILETMADCIDINPQTMVLWLSPPLEGYYKESRLVVYQTISVNGEKHLFFRAICGNHSPVECLSIANQLLETPQFFTDAEQLRATPLLILIEGKESWIKHLGRFVKMPEVWQVITEGQDLQEKMKSLSGARPIIRANHQRITDAKTPYERYLVGVTIEQRLQEQLGITLQSSGPCGILYSDFATQPWAIIIPLEINNLFSSEKRAKFIKNCGACGKELNRYMTKGDRCPYCNGVYKGC